MLWAVYYALGPVGRYNKPGISLLELGMQLRAVFDDQGAIEVEKL